MSFVLFTHVRVGFLSLTRLICCSMTTRTHILAYFMICTTSAIDNVQATRLKLDCARCMDLSTPVWSVQPIIVGNCLFPAVNEHICHEVGGKLNFFRGWGRTRQSSLLACSAGGAWQIWATQLMSRHRARFNSAGKNLLTLSREFVSKSRLFSLGRTCHLYIRIRYLICLKKSLTIFK